MFRSLSEAEIARLIEQKNSADNWNDVSVVGTFFIDKIRNCHFAGKTVIHENVSLINVGFIKNYEFFENCSLINVGKICFSAQKFAIKAQLCNEDGRYEVELTHGMNCTDVFTALAGETPDLFSTDSENYEIGKIGENCKICNTKSIINSIIGNNCNIFDSCSIENCIIDDDNEKTEIGSNVILRNVIVGRKVVISNSSIIYDSLICQCCKVGDGARIYSSVVGDNSQIFGCEVGHSFLYPFHSQHHSNSFTIAAHVQGQCNVAAGATLGSNHNGRNSNGEFYAERGFWAGLCTSVAFPSSFAPFTLLHKGDYNFALNIPFAFSLVSNNLKDNRLEIMPAYWWMYNSYALLRNEIKFEARKNLSKLCEIRPLAADTICAVIKSHKLLTSFNENENEDANTFFDIENSRREVKILKIEEAVKAYESMILCFALQTFGLEKLQKINFPEIVNDTEFINAGGQILSEEQLQTLCSKKENCLQKNHELQELFYESRQKSDENTAKFALQYLIYHGKHFNSTFSFAKDAMNEQIKFYERVIKNKEKDNSNKFRTFTNPYFRKNIDINDKICKIAQENINKLKESLENLQ